MLRVRLTSSCHMSVWYESRAQTAAPATCSELLDCRYDTKLSRIIKQPRTSRLRTGVIPADDLDECNKSGRLERTMGDDLNWFASPFLELRWNPAARTRSFIDGKPHAWYALDQDQRSWQLGRIAASSKTSTLRARDCGATLQDPVCDAPYKALICSH